MRWLILGLGVAGAAPAFAHDGEVHGLGWTLSPAIVGPLAVLLLVHAIGWARLWVRSEQGRGRLKGQLALFLAGWVSLAAALLSPLHEGGETSFTLHMIEHEIIMLLSALLIVAARPGPMLLWAWPAGMRRPLGRMGRWRLWDMLSEPLTATAVQAVAIIGWHVPGPFDLALRSDTWHALQHLSFIASALLFWWAMLHGRSGPFVSATCLFATSMIGGGLGALMALSTSPWYAAYAQLGLTPAGLTPEQDQQLAGLIMWVPGGLWHLAAAILFLTHGLRTLERRHALQR